LPGSNAKAIAKARTLPADVIVMDLEDAVAPDAKLIARNMVIEALSQVEKMLFCTFSESLSRSFHQGVQKSYYCCTGE
jgi:citrate lyase beta subunit